jgi:glycosyltransferase involved in cell wall biosynthesis
MRVDILGKGVAAHKVSVIPNGCDRGVFGVDHASAVAALRASRDWLGQRRLVLFGGTLGLANGVGYLVSIAEAMRRLDPEIRFVVIGDGAERAAIAEMARHKGVLDQTFFMPGAMPKRELAVWLAACDMAVGLFSGPRVLWKDAVQNKFFDALAAGKPVACNFSGFQSELAVQHDVGLIFDAGDAELAARQMHSKLNDDAWLAAVRVRALRLAADDFDRDRLAERLGDVLDAAAKS